MNLRTFLARQIIFRLHILNSHGTMLFNKRNVKSIASGNAAEKAEQPQGFGEKQKVAPSRRQCGRCHTESVGSRNGQAAHHRAERRELPSACHGHCSRRGETARTDRGGHKWEKK